MVGYVQRRQHPCEIQSRRIDLRARCEPAPYLRIRPPSPGPGHPLLRRISRGPEAEVHRLCTRRASHQYAQASERCAEQPAQGLRQRHSHATSRGRDGRRHRGRTGQCRAARRPLLCQPTDEGSPSIGHQRQPGGSRATPHHARAHRHLSSHRHAGIGCQDRCTRQVQLAQPHRLCGRRLCQRQGQHRPHHHGLAPRGETARRHLPTARSRMAREEEASQERQESARGA